MKRVLLIEEVPQVADHLKSLLAREGNVEISGVVPKGEAGIAQAISEHPDVVLIDALMQGKLTGAEIARRIRAAVPAARIVMVTVPKKPVQAASEAGIDAVFVLPGGAIELGKAMGVGAGAARGGKGQVIAVYSPKGGTGKSTLAVNITCALRRDGSSVALVDGVMQFGSVRHLLAPPAIARSILDLPSGAAMRPAMAQTLWEGPEGISVLLAPPKPEDADLVAPAEVANAMTLLADTHDFVIADAPSRLSEDTLAVLDAADVVLLVVTYMGAAVANARAVVDTFGALGYTGHKPILIVVNQADMKGGMTKAALEQAIGLPVTAEIPSDWKLVSEANNKHTPFVIAEPAAPVSQAVRQLAAAVVKHRS